MDRESMKHEHDTETCVPPNKGSRSGPSERKLFDVRATRVIVGRKLANALAMGKNHHSVSRH